MISQLIICYYPKLALFTSKLVFSWYYLWLFISSFALNPYLHCSPVNSSFHKLISYTLANHLYLLSLIRINHQKIFFASTLFNFLIFCKFLIFLIFFNHFFFNCQWNNFFFSKCFPFVIFNQLQFVLIFTNSHQKKLPFIFSSIANETTFFFSKMFSIRDLQSVAIFPVSTLFLISWLLIKLHHKYLD